MRGIDFSRMNIEDDWAIFRQHFVAHLANESVGKKAKIPTAEEAQSLTENTGYCDRKFEQVI